MAEKRERASGCGGNRKSSSIVELDDLGITKIQSHRWQFLRWLDSLPWLILWVILAFFAPGLS
jgi:hypothetical protein